MTVERAKLRETRRRIAAASGRRWSLDLSGDRAPRIRVELDDGRHTNLRVTRDAADASLDDIVFIASLPEDLAALVSHLAGEAQLSSDELDRIEERHRRATPGPWQLFLEADGGLGGCNVITVSERDEEPDMYLWLEDRLAPDADWQLVASGRQALPELAAAARGRGKVSR